MDVDVDPGEAAELGGPFHAGALRQARRRGHAAPDRAGGGKASAALAEAAGGFLELRARRRRRRGPLSELRETPLHALHVALGARMVPFAGYDMPVQYPAGILKEHLHTRAAAGLFDVSHMGQIALRPRSGDLADAARGAGGGWCRWTCSGWRRGGSGTRSSPTTAAASSTT